jgi:isoquinoline 1-oxidoreductase
MEIKSGVTANGEIIAWDYTAYHAGENAFRGRRGADTPYATDNVKIAVADSNSPLTSGSYRSLGGAVNHFAREVHLDEIAIKLGIDPVALRLRNLNHPRLERALRTAAGRFGWTGREPSGQTGIGVAIGYDTSSFAAECVSLSVTAGEVHVDEVVVGFDCGLVHNPDGARNQIEGSVVMGMGAALWESVEFDGGRVLNPSFSRYRVPRIKDAPEIEVVLTGDADTPPTGAGEPAIVPIAAAIANGVRNATGEPITSIPIVPQLADR